MPITRIAAARARAGADLKVRPYIRPFMVFAGVLALLVGAGLQARPAAQETVDVSRLPLNLDRIQRGLRQSATRDESQGLNIRYVVDVFGQAPPLVFLRPEDNLVYGPVPYGAPTHKDMIEHVTPKEYRAPAADFSALLRWLAERSNKK